MKAEILAPAGSYEGLKAAINAGADAVYIGGTRFGARAFADNLTTKELQQAIDFCHIHGRKLYLTVNTLLKDNEMEDLYEYLLPYYERGLDAVIVQDIGVFSYLRQCFPDLDIHASTQMTITGTDGVRFLKEQGAARVVTARELSLAELREIHESVDIEIESFVHGALCYCYSGQCLYSSLIGGRSGNRGRCAQPCRMQYEVAGQKGFFLSPKDICTLEILPDILEAGVYSLKIEGRMKRAEYAAGVVRIYRKYVDYYLKNGRNGYSVSKEDKRMLMELYNRGGFTTGYYESRNGKEMISQKRANHFGTEAAKVVEVQKKQVLLKSLQELHQGDVLESDTLNEDVKKGKMFRMRMASLDGIRPGTMIHRTRDAQLLEELKQAYILPNCKEKINGKLIIAAKKPVILSINVKNTKISVSGEVPGTALNQPLTKEKVRKQICKTGNTPFAFDDLEIELDEGVFLPLQSLNDLRRKALEELEEKLLSKYRRNSSLKLPTNYSFEHRQEKLKLNVSIEDISLFKSLNQLNGIDAIYLDSSSLQIPLKEKDVRYYIEKCHANQKQCLYIMPPIFRTDVKQKYDTAEVLETLACFDGILIKNYEEWYFFKAKNWQKELILDHNMYTFNQSAQYFSNEMKIAHDTAPLELNEKELRRRGCANSELIVYGHLPMMTTVQCICKTTEQCKKSKKVIWMKDRKGKHFPVKNYCDLCYNVIYNQVPLHLLDNKEQIERIKPLGIRLDFTIEEEKAAVAITKSYISRFLGEEEYEYTVSEFTRGHFKRGVE